jgi:hypothetical protein
LSMKQSTTSGTVTKQMTKRRNDATVRNEMICTKKWRSRKCQKMMHTVIYK